MVVEENETSLVAPHGSILAHTMKSASFMMLFSFMLLIEGAARASTGITKVIASTSPSNLLSLVAGLAEVSMSLFGGWAALCYITGQVVQKRTMIVLLVWLHLAGYLVYISYTMAIPGIAIANGLTFFPGVDAGLNTFYGVCAIFTGMSLCFALQGGHISFVFSLYFDEKEYDDRFYKSRANVYLVNMLLVGAWWTAANAIAHSVEGGLQGPIRFAPFFLAAGHTVTPLVCSAVVLLSACLALLVNNVAASRAGIAFALVALGVSAVQSVVIFDHYSAGVAGAIGAGGPLNVVLFATHLVPTINLGMRYSILGTSSGLPPLSIVDK